MRRARGHRSCGTTGRLDDRQGWHHPLPAGRRADRRGSAATPARSTRELTERFGAPVYRRVDAPATPEQKASLSGSRPTDVRRPRLAGEPIDAVLTTAPGNGAPIGGLKVVAANGWFAARPSGTENTYKVYAESFLGDDHLVRILEEAQAVVDKALNAKAG